ncbi:MAG: hypothetical protein M1834_007910 [Cirrosporium novae-zelandiae]|nr:MAG: hypothetical protein M1834_007910 [Cirrosporium novae-zelandiae]
MNSLLLLILGYLALTVQAYAVNKQQVNALKRDGNGLLKRDAIGPNACTWQDGKMECMKAIARRSVHHPTTSDSSSAASPSSASSSPNHTGAIVGGVLGGLAAIALIAGAIIYFMRNRRNQQRGKKVGPDLDSSPPVARAPAKITKPVQQPTPIYQNVAYSYSDGLLTAYAPSDKSKQPEMKQKTPSSHGDKLDVPVSTSHGAAGPSPLSIATTADSSDEADWPLPKTSSEISESNKI